MRTSDRAQALKRLPIVVGEIKAEIAKLVRGGDGVLKPTALRPGREPEAWAAWWRDQVFQQGGNPDTGDVPHDLEIELEVEAESRLGPEIGVGVDHDGEAYPIHRPEAEQEVIELYALASGRRTPPDVGVERYITENHMKPRYAGRLRRALKRLKSWMSKRPGGADIQRLNTREAALFMDHLMEGEITTATANSLVSSLGAYWKWMVKRGLANTNPWKEQQRKPRPQEGAQVRAFSEDEVRRLLVGATYLTLHDLMRIAALSGMRINEICNLRVEDAAGEIFNVRDSKTKAGIRRVPIHSDLKALVERRSKDKAAADYLIEELKAPESRSKERSAKASERFTAYRREVGVDEREEGQRVSNVNFHSWRHWFTTKALQAGQPPHLVSAVVGHEAGRSTMTLKVYDSGASEAQLRAVVESVRLPEDVPINSPVGPKMGDGVRVAA
ncbi:MAG: tyrosine-type recombinase/integrase [Caulobacter sp.]